MVSEVDGDVHVLNILETLLECTCNLEKHYVAVSRNDILRYTLTYSSSLSPMHKVSIHVDPLVLHAI